MKLFEVTKVGCFCDAIGHALEKRRGEDVKVLNLMLRVAPFDAKLASAMTDGVRTTLFKMNNAEPKPTLRRVDFALGVERQLMQVFAAPDTSKASIALDQVKITGTYARVQKDRNGYDFVFRAIFGPVGREELEFCQAWLLSQRFVSFAEAEPNMFEDETAESEDDEPDDDPTDQPELPAPMFDDAGREIPAQSAPHVAADKEPARHLPRRHVNRQTAVRAKQAKGRR